MKDIKIVRMIFPNDPTLKLTVHQMFVSVYDVNSIEFYSISSIFGKESRVYGKDKNNYFLIINEDQLGNGFKSPSFIDCAKSYAILNPKKDYKRLSGRCIACGLKERILLKIEECKKSGEHIRYLLNECDVISWNDKLQMEIS